MIQLTRCRTIDSPIGAITLAGRDGCVTNLTTHGGAHPPEGMSSWLRDAGAFSDVVEELEAYFAGERRTFDVALRLEGTSFQVQVWEALREIPYGEVRSYGEIARRIGRPGAARAVGLANGRNPVAVIVPCHRVIGADGSLTGYAGGLPAKRVLLDLERAGTTQTRV
ncbi:MAG: methylated-DNA--[protein]-cysteine S-methyltransferase [Acidimicrobiales bacterium]